MLSNTYIFYKYVNQIYQNKVSERWDFIIIGPRAVGNKLERKCSTTNNLVINVYNHYSCIIDGIFTINESFLD